MVSKWKFLYICYVVYYIVLLVYYIFLLMHPLINKRQSQTTTKSLAKLIMIGTNCSRKATNLSLHRQCFRHQGVWLWHQNRACADMYVREQSMPKVIIWDLKYTPRILHAHYSDVMDTVASEITSLTMVYLTVYSTADQRKHQSPTSLAFVRGIHRSPGKSPHKGPVTRKMFPFDDVIMRSPFLCLAMFWCR